MTTHGLSHTSTYIVWTAMMTRCYNKRHMYYNNYGGRGIRVCKRWHDFEKFLEDMGERPPGRSLDRINSNKGYSVKNCKWATRTEQNRNSSQNRRIKFRGETKCLAEWCDLLDLKYTTVYMRLFYYGWSTEKAFSK